MPGDLGGVDLLGLHADGSLGGQALAHGVDVGFADADDVSGLPEADVSVPKISSAFSNTSSPTVAIAASELTP